MSLEIRHITVDDPLVQPLLDELAFEYRSRYGRLARGELEGYPADAFTPPHGVFLVFTENGRAVAGGAFRRYDPQTAELKRIWTRSTHRRRGLARRVLRELETEAARVGYVRIYLTTGPRQPEARALYLNSGYAPLFDPTANPEAFRHLPFEKTIVSGVPASGSDALNS